MSTPLLPITNMNSPARGGVTWPSTYGGALSASLIAYAEQHHDFAHWLREVVSKLPQLEKKIFIPDMPENIQMLVPADTNLAMQRTEWLIQNRETDLLASWVTDKPGENPKMIVVGVVVVAIPGITMGKFRRRKESMKFMLQEKKVSDTFSMRKNYTGQP